MTFKPFPVLTVFSLLGLAMLLALGLWQFGKYNTKRTFDVSSQDEVRTISVTPLPVDNAQAPIVYGLINAGPVWRAFVPVRETGSDDVFFMDWVAFAGTEPRSIDLSAELKPQTVEGRFVPNKPPSLFAAQDQPELGRWFSPDPAAKARYLGLPDSGPYRVFEPVQLMVVRPADRGGAVLENNPYFEAGDRDDLPPARHLGYAVTWWGLAAGLIGVYIAFHMSKGRLTFGPSTGS